MPGLLKPDACCPVCGQDIVVLVDTTSPDGKVKREYYHSNRKRECVDRFSIPAVAQMERRALEVAL